MRTSKHGADTSRCQLHDLVLRMPAGHIDAEHDVFVMHWPGLLILFPLSTQPAANWQDMQQGRPLPTALPNGTAPVACRMCVHASNAGTASDLNSARKLRYRFVFRSVSHTHMCTTWLTRFGKSCSDEAYQQDILLL